MRIRRLLTAVIATAAFTGLGFTGAATAGDAALTPGECTEAGGTVDWSTIPETRTGTCRGGSLDGRPVD